MHRLRLLCLLPMAVLYLASPIHAVEQEAAATGETLLLLGRIHVRAGAEPVSALAIGADGRVIGAGMAHALRAQLQDAGIEARELAVEGAVVPGLIDAHGHLFGLGSSLMVADLSGSRSLEEVRERLRQHAGLGGEGWLLGRGWDQNRWPGQQFPSAADLDQAFAARPLWLRRVDGHAGWANSAALRAAGIDADTPDPDGGRILRDAEGRPSGVLIDTAMRLVERKLPPMQVQDRRRALKLALAKAVSLGLTGVHDAGVSRQDLALLRELADAGALPLRVYAMADGDSEALADRCREGVYRHPGGRLQMRAVKIYADGALGSRGAALLADYSDDAGNRGLLIQPAEALKALVAKVAGCGLQPAIHAIGDHGNRLVLDAYAALDPAQRARLRPRIEHAQVVAVADIPRFRELDVIASMQPTHATSDMPWALARVGAERLRGAYAWRRFLDADVALAFGSDFPVERVEPLEGLYAALTRQDLDGKPEGGWMPEERLDWSEALAAFTLGAAHAGFAEDELGSLEAGKRADFVVLSADPASLRPRGLLALKVRSTWLDGRQVWPLAD